MGEPDFIIEDMRRKAEEIWRHLEDNLRTYRDDRLPDTIARKEVAVLGARLQESYTNDITTMVLTIIPTVFIGILTAPVGLLFGGIVAAFIITVFISNVRKKKQKQQAIIQNGTRSLWLHELSARRDQFVKK